MRVLTWNVWFGLLEQAARARALVAEIARRRPDVVALQEVTPPLRAFLEEQVAGYTLHGGDSSFGYDVMLLARGPVVDEAVLELPSQMGRRVVAIELASGLTVATVHLESTAPCERERVAQLERIGPWLAARTPDACLVGDMNFDDYAARESDALDDSYVDAWPALRPGEPGYTIDSVRNTMRTGPRGKKQQRLDRVFVRSARWRAAAIEIAGTSPIDGAGTFTSDHFGLEVELAPHPA